jgi:hypothetical protein
LKRRVYRPASTPQHLGIRSAFAVRSSAIGSSRPAEFFPAAVDPAFRTGAWASDPREQGIGHGAVIIVIDRSAIDWRRVTWGPGEPLTGAAAS